MLPQNRLKGLVAINFKRSFKLNSISADLRRPSKRYLAVYRISERFSAQLSATPLLICLALPRYTVRGISAQAAIMSRSNKIPIGTGLPGLSP